MKIIRFGMRGQGMQVGNKKITLGLVLQLGEIPECSEIITQVQMTVERMPLRTFS
jgi:hypothetical protein